MNRIEYSGDVKEVVRAVLQVVTTRARAGRTLGPESIAALVPDVLSRLRLSGCIMTKDRADLLFESTRDRVGEIDFEKAVLNGDFSDEQLDAIVFLMHSARDAGPSA